MGRTKPRVSAEDPAPQQDRVSRPKTPGRMKVLPAVLLTLLLCRQPGQLQCYSCDLLHWEEGCNQTQRCLLGETFCKTFISQGNTGSGPLTTYSLWCADMCKSFTRKVDDTLMTMNCCQTSLCNIPPWQGSQGNGAGDHQGGPKTVAAALLLSLLTGLQAMGS
ncbi:PREDICTED: glycosylphosphatidylinositol-anchored high density lipoprotein-binding protein 1 isoform X4 [Hipposideros armiger]|uniref:Glycosylphosphatidylinositol-anchored high density lipoprotein-binding protein 1 isoform X4 n=1 Tax=Hipposideros armiger TaxID=186990 RepID=A0A8B7SJ09_HIPAR|nr:PREDICTED: glycosylphosphatidylinositol-anchored high density lipoprotein-binding protein 1 isoform X4 [Hipposideros armiger]